MPHSHNLHTQGVASYRTLGLGEAERGKLSALGIGNAMRSRMPGSVSLPAWGMANGEHS